MNQISTLPEGYVFVYGDQITPEEVFSIRLSTGWESEEKPSSKDGWLSYPASALISVGVRHIETNELVGMGFIVGNHRHAVLCDFNVNPAHQHKGIGRAILAERIRLSDDLSIIHLYTELASSNPLSELYISMGFYKSDSLYVRRYI